MRELLSEGARFVENESKMLVVIREQTAERVVFSYEQNPQASHSYQRDAFIRDFSPVKVNEINLDAYYDDQRRVNSLMGSTCAPVPATPENISRNRLLRTQVGLRHLLTEVIPQITDEQQRREIYLWVDGVFTISQCEQSDMKAAHDYTHRKIKQVSDQVIFAKASVDLIRQIGVNGKAERMLESVNGMLVRALSALGECAAMNATVNSGGQS